MGTVLGASLLAAGVLGCGGAGQGGATIVVGRRPLTRATIEGFETAVRRGSTFPWLLSALSTPAEQASAVLIRYRWLIGEAHAEGFGVDDAMAGRVLLARESSYTGGRSVYRAALRQTGETESQARLAVAAELSAQRLLSRLRRSVGQPSSSAVESYYRRHLSQWRVPEERFFDLAERIVGTRELAGAKRAFALGHKIPGAAYEVEFGESLARSLVAKLAGDRGAVVRAIFSSSPGVVRGPFQYFGQSAIFKVDRIVPSYVMPLSRVRGRIAAKIRAAALAQAEARFLARWRSSWTAKTTCSPRYVAPGCREFHGTAPAEVDPLSPE